MPRKILLLIVLFICQIQFSQAAFVVPPSSGNPPIVKPIPTENKETQKHKTTILHKIINKAADMLDDASPMAIASILCGGLSLLGLFVFPVFALFAIPAIITGLIVLNRNKKTRTDKIFAWVGIASGGVSLLLLIGLVIVILALLQM